MTAEYRSVQTRMWREDEWFQSLDTDARLLFIYLFTNPSASIAGIYRLPLRTIEFESGLDKARITELLTQFSAANKAHYADGVVWVVKMRENQIPGAISPKVQVRLDKDIAAIPNCPLKIRYLKHYGYPIDTLSILDRTDTETDTVTETHTPTANGGGLNGFTDRRVAYAYHVTEAKKAGVDAPTFTVIVDKLIDAAGWRALVDAAQDDRKLTQAKDQALALVRMGITTPGQVDTLLDGYREANDWRKTPPTPQAIAEYASQVNGRVKAKTTKTAWVLDSNGNRIEKVQVTA